MSEMLAIVGLVLVCYLAYLMRRIVAGINRIGYHIVEIQNMGARQIQHDGGQAPWGAWEDC